MPTIVTTAGRWAYRFWAGLIFERSRMPGVIVATAVLVAAPPLHLAAGTVLALNWGISKVPSLVSAAAAIRIREFRRWSRPQAYQGRGVAVAAPPEIDLDRAWKVPKWQRRLTVAAEHNRVAAQFDDWFSERSRLVSYALDIGTVALGQFVAAPTVVTFLVNGVVARIPELNSLMAAVVNHSFRRYAMPGSFQRNEVLSRRARSNIAAVRVEVVGRTVNDLGRSMAPPTAASIGARFQPIPRRAAIPTPPSMGKSRDGLGL